MIGDIPNLWPDFDNGQPVVTPKAILHRQALVITERTQEKVRGEVTTKVLGREFIHTMMITAPELADFRHFVISARHAIDIFYPLRIALSEKDDGSRECANESEFVELLRHVLAHNRTIETVNALVAQSV